MTYAVGQDTHKPRQLADSQGNPIDTTSITGLLEPATVSESIDQLYADFMPLGVPNYATVPVVDALVDQLTAPNAPRALIITFIHNVARWVAVSTREEITQELSVRARGEVASSGNEVPHAILEVFDAAPRWGRALAPFVSDPDPETALAAARAVMRCEPLLRPTIADALVRLADPSGPGWQRASAVFLLGHLGHDARTFVDDDDRYVRLVAALSPALASDAHADRVLADVLLEPVDVNVLGRVFGGLPGVLAGTIWRLLTSRVAAAGSLTQAALVDVALAIAADPPVALTDAAHGEVVHEMAVEEVDTADTLAILSPVLRLFTAVLRDTDLTQELTAAQRRYLAVVVADDGVWDPENSVNAATFARVGLPFDRQQVRDLVAAKH